MKESIAIKKKTVIGSLIWKICERGSAQLISLIVQIVLARILAPELFGIVAILLVFINIANVIIQKGFASSLIRKKDASDLDFNTAFLVSEGIAIACIIVIFFLAPFLESIYQTNELALYLRALSGVLVFGALNSIQNAALVRQMEFKKIFVRSFFAALGSGIISIFAALMNLGIWVLIIQTISQNILLCLITAFQCPWKPRLQFSKLSFNEIFSFGSKILVAEIISIVVEDIRTLVIGKKYSTEDLAYYDRGQVYPATAMSSIYDAIMSVMLPVFSKSQDDRKILASQVERACLMSSFVTFPLFIGFASVARPFVLLLLTDKWLASVPFIIVFCIYQLSFPIYGIMRQGLYAIGRSDVVLKLESLKAGYFLFAILIGIQISPLGVAIATGVSMYVATITYVISLKKFVPFNISTIIRNLSKTLLSCIIMYGVIGEINFIVRISPIVTLIIDIVIGTLVFIVLNIILKNQQVILLKNAIGKIKKGDNNNV